LAAVKVQAKLDGRALVRRRSHSSRLVEAAKASR
jgi:hypothetical protein